MKVAVAIETKDRRIPNWMSTGGENYLGQTLNNLGRSGFWSSPYLHSLQIVGGGELSGFWDEQVRPFVPAGAPFALHECPPGGRTRQQNGAMAIRVAAETDADIVLKLEDDLDFCHDFLGSAVRWLSDVLSERGVCFYALAAPFQAFSEARYAREDEYVGGPGKSFPFIRGLMQKGVNFARHPAEAFWAAQAIAFRRHRALELVKWLGDDPCYRSRHPESLRKTGHDLLLGLWAKSAGEVIGAAVPSFVQHIGRQSSISSRGRFFQFPWPGREWSYAGRQTEEATA
jgi:hypothetical protein